MMTLRVLALTCLTVLTLAPAVAADLSLREPVRKAPVIRDSIRFCPAERRSAIASMPTLEAMNTQTNELYEISRAIYESDRTQNSRAMTLKWADLARITCGIAVGYLSSGEVNVDRLSDCECNYVRMTRF